jgi:hypothetical protein
MFMDGLFSLLLEIFEYGKMLLEPVVIAAVIGIFLELGWEKTFAELIQRAIPTLKKWQPAFIILIGLGIAYGLGIDFFVLFENVDISGDFGEVLTGLLFAAVAMYRHEVVNR